MINGMKPDDAASTGHLPPELRELDRELSAIRIEERPSFGPELERELTRSWQDLPGDRSPGRKPWVRTLLAAGLAGLMIAGVSVPSARALVRDLVNTVVTAVASEVTAPVPETEVSGNEVEVPVFAPAEAPTERAPAPPPALRTEEEITEAAEAFTPSMNITFPSIRYMQEAEALIASFYPLALQRAGVGGSVKLMFWVGKDGVPENVQMREGSGYRSLNYAAMRAARELRFEPATRDGDPVGTWVEFVVHFVPGSGSGFMELDPVGSGEVGGY